MAWKITDYILVTLTPFSRSQEGWDCWIMACLHAICWMNGWILTKLAQLYCWDRDENWLSFVTLIPFSRSHKGYDFRKWIVSTLSHRGMDEFWPNLHIDTVFKPGCAIAPVTHIFMFWHRKNKFLRHPSAEHLLQSRLQMCWDWLLLLAVHYK